MKPLLLQALLFLGTNICAQNRYDVIINELMADPTPQVGLPNNEWIELKNVSALPISLQNWRIGDATGQSGPMPNFVLQPNSYVIVCTAGAVAALSAFGTTISVTSFPSLDNDADQLFLKAANGTTIHAVAYTLDWYDNELKKEGGWSLEIIDGKNPCTGIGNWKASTHTAGGTPGKINSVDGTNNDQTGPKLKNAYTTDNSTIVLVYDEPVDSLSGATRTNYSIDGGLSFIAAVTLPPLFNQVQLKTNGLLQPHTVYAIIATNVTDCKINAIANSNKIKTGLPADAITGELIINEILFDPKPGGYDFIECYNKSNKIFDASKLYIANRNSNGIVSSIKAFSTTARYIFPGDYIVVTENANSLAMQYLVKYPEQVMTIATLPSFADEEGDVIVLNAQGAIVDEVKYNKAWHFKLIDNAEGVSLERIDPSGVSQEAGNWHSAASTAGYGTPTYQNSQFKNIQAIDAAITLTPAVFSPDNDGLDDIASIQYKISGQGYLATITVFDAAGRPVKNLVRNALLGTAGYWNWDGLNDKGQKLPVGTYILLTEIFNLQGKKQTLKNTVVLARKLN